MIRRAFYVGDGQSGLWRWVYASAHIGGWWLWQAVPKRLTPSLPDGWAWNVRKDDTLGLYARHDS